MTAAARLDDYLKWQSNPCGKPPLCLEQLTREGTLSNDGRHCIMVTCEGYGPLTGADRKACLTNLEGAYHWDRKFPGLLESYYEGPHPDDPNTHVIAIYGAGQPFRAKPQPPKAYGL